MLYLFIIAVIAFVYVLSRLILLKKEIKRADRQLGHVNKQHTGKKLTVHF
ncbi:hypothetical protein [Jeotgalibacillus proteolyticus]|nr:hypothetical protein [Jeotgalibacillus proteolyticus]